MGKVGRNERILAVFAVVIVAASDNYAEGEERREGGRFDIEESTSRERCRGRDRRSDRKHAPPFNNSDSSRIAAELIVVSILGELLTLLIE